MWYSSIKISQECNNCLDCNSCCECNKCKTSKVKSKLEGELKIAILKKAALFEKDDFKKYKETEGKKRGKSVIKKN